MNRLYLEIDGVYRRIAEVDIVGKLGNKGRGRFDRAFTRDSLMNKLSREEI